MHRKTPITDTDWYKTQCIEFPYLPAESNIDYLYSNEMQTVVSVKRKLSNTTVLDSQTDIKKLGLERAVVKVKLKA